MVDRHTQPRSTFHPAPWSRLLMGMSVLATGICLGVAVLLVTRDTVSGRLAALGIVWLVAGALFFVVRGYEVRPDAIVVRRLLWTTRLSIADLREVRVDPAAMRKCWRVLGNGGLFSFTGYYRSARLGPFRAFVTDPERAVVLRYDRRTVVVSPLFPDTFAKQVEQARER